MALCQCLFYVLLLLSSSLMYASSSIVEGWKDDWLNYGQVQEEEMLHNWVCMTNSHYQEDDKDSVNDVAVMMMMMIFISNMNTSFFSFATAAVVCRTLQNRGAYLSFCIDDALNLSRNNEVRWGAEMIERIYTMDVAIKILTSNTPTDWMYPMVQYPRRSDHPLRCQRDMYIQWCTRVRSTLSGISPSHSYVWKVCM